MVFTGSDTPILKVLDGQQRLATTLIIFSAIPNWLRAYFDNDKDQHLISSTYLTNDDVGSDAIEPKLTMAPANNDIFQAFVVQPAKISDINRESRSASSDDRSKSLLNSIQLINSYVEQRAQKFATREEAKAYLIDLVSFIRDKCRVVRFVVEGDDAAYTIFETLNDRGLELAALDLVKNYLFSRAERHRVGGLREAEQRWAEMMTLLGSARADSFLRAFYLSKHKKVDGPKLFAEFKKIYDGADKAFAVSLELRRAAERYGALFSAKDSVWASFSDRAKRSVEGLSIIGVSQFHPVVLAAMDRFDQREMERLLRLLEVIAVRYQLVKRGRPGRIESLGSKAALDITEGRVRNAHHVREALDELYVPDGAFEEQFAIKTEREGKKARYLLTCLERQSIQKDGQHIVDELLPGDVTLEHIFPNAPKRYWGDAVDADPTLHKEMFRRLGNMCLLSGFNADLGNKAWPDKVAVFAKSRIQSTYRLTNYVKWGREEIEDRQRRMAKLAVAEWRFE